MSNTAPILPINDNPAIIVETIPSQVDIIKINGCSLCEYLKEVMGVPTCTKLTLPIHQVAMCPIDRWRF